MKNDIIIGIDPGKKTGIACWYPANQRFKSIQTVNIIKAMLICENYHKQGVLKKIIFEDARQRIRQILPEAPPDVRTKLRLMQKKISGEIDGN